MDPPWNSKQSVNAPSTTPTSSNAQAESQLQNLVTELKKRETPITPEDIEQLIEETTTPVITSKNVHSAVSRVNQARAKLQTTTSSTVRRRHRRQRSQARFLWHCHNKGYRRLQAPQLRHLYFVLKQHHSRDPAFLAQIRTAMTTKEPWRCKWCYRLNREAALRCGSCDELWHRCLDKTYVHGGRGSSSGNQSGQWNYTGWQDTVQDRPTQRRPKSPRGKSAGKTKSPRGRRVIHSAKTHPIDHRQVLSAKGDAVELLQDQVKLQDTKPDRRKAPQQVVAPRNPGQIS